MIFLKKKNVDYLCMYNLKIILLPTLPHPTITTEYLSSTSRSLLILPEVSFDLLIVVGLFPVLFRRDFNIFGVILGAGKGRAFSSGDDFDPGLFY